MRWLSVGHLNSCVTWFTDVNVKITLHRQKFNENSFGNTKHRARQAGLLNAQYGTGQWLLLKNLIDGQTDAQAASGKITVRLPVNKSSSVTPLVVMFLHVHVPRAKKGGMLGWHSNMWIGMWQPEIKKKHLLKKSLWRFSSCCTTLIFSSSSWCSTSSINQSICLLIIMNHLVTTHRVVVDWFFSLL